jgi:hypothetical protein
MTEGTKEGEEGGQKGGWQKEKRGASNREMKG